MLIMEVKDYQDIIKKTAVYPADIGILYCALGLCGEAGEVSEKIKKLYRDSPLLVHEIEMSKFEYGFSSDKGMIKLDDHSDSKGLSSFKDSLKKEIGDVIWYCTALANEFKIPLSEILETNYNKLIERRTTGTLHGSGDNRETL